jgi:PAS domain S-box-containing protein
MPRASRPSSRAPVRGRAAPPSHEREILRHDLEVHQEELRAQNEKLVAALQTLEEARDRYVALYDFAPNGYCTLDERGVIVELNVSAAALLGRPRMALVGTPLLPSIAPDDRPRFLKFLRSCRLAATAVDAPVVEECGITTVRGEHVVQLTCSPRVSHPGVAHELFLSIVDVTERRRLEAAREQARREHVALVRRMLTLQEQERQRIARDIHDDLGQQVTALRLKLAWLAGVAKGHPSMQAGVGIVQEAAIRIDRHIDFLMRALRPAGLDDLGLVSALEQMVQDWGTTFGIAAEFRSSGLDGWRLAPDAEAHVYRIAQEALNNVHKHAEASRVTVTLERRGERSVLLVEDDGVGINTAMPASTGRRGLGLLGMHERATLAGGTLDVTSQPGSGTRVILELP